MQKPSVEDVKRSVESLIKKYMRDTGKPCFLKMRAEKDGRVGVAVIDNNEVVRPFKDFFEFTIEGQKAGSGPAERIALSSVLSLSSYVDPIRDAIRKAEAETYTQMKEFESHLINEDGKFFHYLVMLSKTGLKFYICEQNESILGNIISEITEPEILLILGMGVDEEE